MNETPPTGPSPEEQEALDEMARYDDWMKNHPEPVIEALRESGPEVARFGELVRQFEESYDMGALHATVDFEKEDRRRNAAKADLGPIFAIKKAIKNETNISPEKMAEVEAQWKRLDRAVGMVGADNKIDHTR